MTSRKRRRIFEESDSDTEGSLVDFVVDDDSDEEYSYRKPLKSSKNLKEIYEYIKNSRPDINKIVSTPLIMKDKAEIYLLYKSANGVRDDIERLKLFEEISEKYQEAIKRKSKYDSHDSKIHTKINQELKNINESEENDLKMTILTLPTSLKNKKIIYKEFKRLGSMDRSNEEYSKLYCWLQNAIKLPYDNYKIYCMCDDEISIKLRNFHNLLNQELYGMDKIKEQIILYLHARFLNPQMKRSSLGLIGPPGVGKTYIIKLISQHFDMPLEQISLGGINSSDFLLGHQYAYIGSKPGKIVTSLQHLKCNNGIIFFDEYDKIADRKEISSALLHITDPSQNSQYQDNYLMGIDMDLSNIWFIYSMNERPCDSALADRIHYIYVPSYSQNDKYVILKDYILPRIHRLLKWKKNSLKFKKNSAEYLIEQISPNTVSGVRSLEHATLSIANKINFLLHNDKDVSMSFNLNKKVKFPFTVNYSDMKKLI